MNAFQVLSAIDCKVYHGPGLSHYQGGGEEGIIHHVMTSLGLL